MATMKVTMQRLVFRRTTRWTTQYPVMLLLFAIPDDDRRRAARQLQKEETTEWPEIPLNSFHSCTMDNLVTSNSMNLFRLFRLPSEFLSTDRDMWEEQESYAAAKRRLSTLKVVTDTAERGGD